jgi:hypothetical protein
MKAYGEWMYRSTCLTSARDGGVGRLQVPAPFVEIVPGEHWIGAGWDPEPIWKAWRREKLEFHTVRYLRFPKNGI